MNTWTPSSALSPEVELLVRRWHLPMERVADVQRLLVAQSEGGTAWLLPTVEAGTNWGDACHVPPEQAGVAVNAPRPLVLRKQSGQQYLQSWRFFQAETIIAREIVARAERKAPPLSRPAADLVSELGADQVNAQQAQAIVCALQHTLALITGGPGTGKTHTLARLIALLIEADPSVAPLIRLAAPTGKAADRMKEAVEAAADRLPTSISDQTKRDLKRVAARATTLHALLGFNPGTGRCRYHAGEPLGAHIVIVDECSMVDALLWQALLAALRPSARLVLVGDPNQLESVTAGDVLGSIIRFAGTATPGGLRQVWVELTQSQRFQGRPGIGALATAVVNRQTEAALMLLMTHAAAPGGALPDDGLVWLRAYGTRFEWAKLPTVIQDAITAVADAATPQAALSALGKIRLLTAHREHGFGASGLNEAIQRHLLRLPAGRPPNQPIIINRNDPDTHLTNGSVGILMEIDEVRAAYFPAASEGGAPRRVALGQLADYSPAWAMTIHRSQGAEFDHVVVILPSEESPLATRELFYTAITRARQCVYVWGGEPSVRAVLTAKPGRCTLLQASLQTATSTDERRARGLETRHPE